MSEMVTLERMGASLRECSDETRALLRMIHIEHFVYYGQCRDPLERKHARLAYRWLTAARLAELPPRAHLLAACGVEEDAHGQG